jgi:tetratricopeptide (TPR) repeat protein
MTSPSELADLGAARPLRALFFELGCALLTEQRAREAAQSLRQSLAENGAEPPNWQIHYFHALACQQADDATSALRAFLEAVAEAPRQATELLPLARRLVNPQTAAAIAEWLFGAWAGQLAQADLNPQEKTEVSLLLGQTRLHSGEADQAELCFEQAVQSQPGDPRVMMEIGEAFRRAGRLAQAEEYFQAAAHLAGKGRFAELLPRINAGLIHLLVDQGKFEAALARIGQAGDRLDDELQLARGRACLALGRFAEALAAAEAISSEKFFFEQNLLRAQALIGLSRYPEAVSVVSQVQGDIPTLVTIQALIEGRIDLDRAERLLLNLSERAGLEPIREWLRSPLVAARQEDGDAHYFVAQTHFMLAPELPLEAALPEVERALSLGMSGEGTYPEVAAWQLKGEILEELAGCDAGATESKAEIAERKVKAEEAASAFYEAGRRWYWEKNYLKAEAQLERAAKLNDKHPLTWWYLSDVRLSLSYTNAPPWVDERILRQAQRDFESGLKALSPALPESSNSWAYVVRAMISERLALLPGENTNERTWEAIVWLERAILLRADEPYRQATLAREYRNLSVEMNALHAVERALQSGQDELLTLEEKAGILCNLGVYEEAIKTLDQLRERTPHYVYDGWKAFVFYYLGKTEEGLELIKPWVEAEREGLWGRAMRADLSALAGAGAQALADYQWLREQRGNPVHKDAEFQFARAAMMIALLDQNQRALLAEAKAGFSGLRDQRSDAALAHLHLCVCDLATGDEAQARKNFTEGFLPQSFHRRLFDEAGILFAQLLRLAQEENLPHPERLRELIGPEGEFTVQLTTRLDEVTRHPLTPQSELEGILADSGEAREGPSCWIAANAGLARLCAEEKRYDAAREIYLRLLPYRAQFPEAQTALNQTTDLVVNEGRQQLQTGQFAEAQKQFARAREMESAEGRLKTLAELSVLAGAALAGEKKSDEAKRSFLTALDEYRRASVTGPGDELGRVCSENIAAADHYWAIDDALKEIRDAADDPRAFNRARAALSEWLSRRFNLTEQSDLKPVVTPIALEIGQDLVPAVENPDDWILLKEYAPQMRERLKRETGVYIPGLRVHYNEGDMPADNYLLMLDEVPLVMGALQMDKHYCPAPMEKLEALGIPPWALSAAIHPGTNEPGCWVAKEFESLITQHQLELWRDPHLYIIHHLESLLRQNLSLFLGAQEVANLLDEWAGQPEGATLVSAAAPDLTAQIRLGRVLRALLSEQVTTAPWREILSAVRDTGLADDPQTAVRAARLRLKKFLPGNQPQQKRTLLPEAIESELAVWVEEQDGKRFLAIPPADTMELLKQIRELVQPDYPRLTLLVRDAALRPFVRQLVALEFPRLMTLAEEEQL